MGTLRKALFFSVPRVLNATAIPSRSYVPTSSLTSHTLYRPFVGLFSRFYSSNQNSQSFDYIDLSTEESKRRLFNRLVYRSKQRGYLELDLILGKWVEEHIHSMDQKGIKALVDVLNDENPDLWKWLSGQQEPPESISINPGFIKVREKVMENLETHAAPEVRAAPGQPWVRAWDNFKKGRDSPIVGNQ